MIWVVSHQTKGLFVLCLTRQKGSVGTTQIVFAENQLYPSAIGVSPLPPIHPRILPHPPVRPRHGALLDPSPTPDQGQITWFRVHLTFFHFRNTSTLRFKFAKLKTCEPLMQKVRRLYRPTAFFLGFPVLFQLSFNFPSQYYFTIGISFFLKKGAGPQLTSISQGDPSGPPPPFFQWGALVFSFFLCSIYGTVKYLPSLFDKFPHFRSHYFWDLG